MKERTWQDMELLMKAPLVSYIVAWQIPFLDHLIACASVLSLSAPMIQIIFQS